jgi:hypothetical protein
MSIYKFKEEKTVKVRFFRKQLYGRIKNIDNVFSVFGALDLSFNWVDYMGGVKQYDLPEEPAAFNSDFIFGVLVKKPDEKYRPVFAIKINDDCLL